MSRDQQREPGDVTVLVDVGSTYTKAVCVASDGAVLPSGQAPPATAHVDTGFGYAMDAALAGLSPARPARPGRVIASSSAAGGLRLFVVGLEASLTVEAGKRAAVSAGARVV